MSARLTLVLAAALLVFRAPSLVQPMGADQALYAYVGERIRAGGLPYRDAWDQKPPAIHFLYAGLRTLLPSDGVVPAADLVAAAAIAWLLYRLAAQGSPAGTGAAAALVFLLLSNPAFTRVAGIRLRSQCETFIAVAVTAAFVLLLGQGKLLARKGTERRSGAMLGAGVLFGLAFAFKYNAAVFAAAGVVSLWLCRRLTIGDCRQSQRRVRDSGARDSDHLCPRRRIAAPCRRDDSVQPRVLGRDVSKPHRHGALSRDFSDRAREI